ncbi:MAG: 2,3,4,5-tetrahydropyridine-2,6-dicarboxylate N-succinyltransferase [Acidimicrobiales bacterium]|nr:2,3,4,5-tetrahydropyridine-2,6-dicarboxylate N-succinyltransferase [Acidimicrobiales bacterium]
MSQKGAVEELFENREDLDVIRDRPLIEKIISGLDCGLIRVAQVNPDTDQVEVNEWIKKAILLWFRVNEMQTLEVGPFEYADRLKLKSNYEASKVRVVPGASARFGSYLAPGVVLMPSYVNIGAYVGEGTMVDTWATVGSCAQIGARVHLSGGVGIGGVLEPPQAAPVIIEDDAYIGSRAMIVEGARVCKGAVVGAGVILNPSIPVIDAKSGEEISRGVVPPWSVAVGASRERKFEGGTFYLPCVLVIKHLEVGERHSKTALEDLLRSHGVAT